MAFKQPRVPEYRESEGVSRYIKPLILFLKDFTMSAWTANNMRKREIETLREEMGSIEIPEVAYPVTSVNQKKGDVVLSAADVGARSDTWMPTAQEVGARPDSWMPTAADVGARPDSWTPTAEEVGAKTSEEILPAASYAVGAQMLFAKPPDEYEYIMGRLNYTGIVPVYGSGSGTRTYILTSFTTNDTNLSIYMVRITGAENQTAFTIGSIKRIAFNLSTSVVKAQDIESINIGALYGVK